MLRRRAKSHMQGFEVLYVVLAVALVVPVVVMWRTRILRLEAHIEVPPAEPDSVPAPASGVPQPEPWTVSDAAALGQMPQPIRAGSLLPVSASQRPVTVSDGSPKPPPVAETLPLPVRRPIIEPIEDPVPMASDEPENIAMARASGLPVPLMRSLAPSEPVDET